MAYDGDEKQFTRVDSDATLILRRARELVSEGWCQHALSKVAADGKELVCMSGGVSLARDKLHVSFVAHGDALDRLKAAISCNNLRGIVDFNDAPGRTQEEVLAVFDQAIGD